MTYCLYSLTVWIIQNKKFGVHSECCKTTYRLIIWEELNVQKSMTSRFSFYSSFFKYFHKCINLNVIQDGVPAIRLTSYVCLHIPCSFIAFSFDRNSLLDGFSLVVTLLDCSNAWGDLILCRQTVGRSRMFNYYQDALLSLHCPRNQCWQIIRLLSPASFISPALFYELFLSCLIGNNVYRTRKLHFQ